MQRLTDCKRMKDATCFTQEIGNLLSTTRRNAMPSEIRHVMFTSDEVTTAIRSYCLGGGRILPGNAIFAIDGGAQPSVRVTSQTGHNQRETSAFFAGEALI